MSGPLRVAVVGAGAAGAYAASHLLRARPDAEVTVLERLPTPWGLIRSGVAPDHQRTKLVTGSFDWLAGSPGFRFALGVEVGRDVTVEELRARHHAVVVACGAASGRRLGIAGEELPGCLGATEFVAWYNGHPDHADLAPDLTSERVVVVGNGNVALDVARVLTMGPDALARTDAADHALEALRGSAVREVVVLGRRGPAEAAFTTAELLGLRRLEDVDVVVQPAGALDDVAVPAGGGARAYAVAQKLRVLREIAAEGPSGASRRIVLRFFGAPAEVRGATRVEGLAVARTALVPLDDGGVGLEVTEEVDELETGLVLRSIGYRGTPLEGLPFDEARGVIPHEAGRVVGEPGVYVTGWIKRGPTGVIGTNKHCAAQTVQALLADHAAGALPEPSGRPALPAGAVGLRGWQAIDAAERAAGAAHGRPRVKLVRREELLAAAAGQRRAMEEEVHVP